MTSWGFPESKKQYGYDADGGMFAETPKNLQDYQCKSKYVVSYKVEVRFSCDMLALQHIQMRRQRLVTAKFSNFGGVFCPEKLVGFPKRS